MSTKEKSLLSPTLDFIFKLIFANNIELLIDLLNVCLFLPNQRKIKSLDVRNPEIVPEDIQKKFIILDILAIDEEDNHYNIEMQASRYHSYGLRAIFYLCKLVTDQLNSGEEYGLLKPVMGVHFLNFIEFPEWEEDFYSCFEMRERRHPERKWTDHFALHVFELPKLENEKCARQIKDSGLIEWLQFFHHAHQETEKSMRTQYTNPAIHKAFHVLEQLSADEKTRQQAEKRKKALRDENSQMNGAFREGWKGGEEKGIEKGFLKFASNLLRFRFKEEAETWITRLPEYSEASLEKIGERLLKEDTLESIFQGLEKK